MATPTGHDWGAWEDTIASTALTQGGTVLAVSASAVDLDIKSACEVSVSAAYDAAALVAGTGLYVYVCRDTDGTNYEDIPDAPWGFVMKHTASNTRLKTFSVDPGSVGSFKIRLSWTNSTASAAVTCVVKVRTAAVPIAVA